MIRFNLTMGGLEVFVVNGPDDERQVGGIDRTGFFSDPVVGPQQFVRLSPEDLRHIADRTVEFTGRGF